MARIVPQNFDAVRLFPARPFDCQPDSPGFRFPVRFKLEAAATADFSDARVLLDKTAADQPNPHGWDARHWPALTRVLADGTSTEGDRRTHCVDRAGAGAAYAGDGADVHDARRPLRGL